VLKYKKTEDEVNLYTFYALKEGGFLSKLFPRLKTAPRTSIVLNAYTFITRISNKFLRKIGMNHRENEVRMFELLAPRVSIENCDVLHYWPFYCAKMVERIKQDNKGICTVAEYYEAEPSYANNIYDQEYIRFGLKSEDHGNLKIDQNQCFKFENNIIVPSEFTKETYQSKFPNKTYFVCSYGSAGYELCDNYEEIIDFNVEVKSKRIVFVGQVCVEKGVHYLIEAVKNLDVTLDLIGPIRKGQEELFSSLIGGSDNVKYIGAKKNHDVLLLLKEYQIFCMPSLSDSYSLASVEALSRGLPVIVTESCGIKDNIKQYQLGYVAQVQSAASIKECIGQFYGSFDYSQFKIGLREFFSEEYSQKYPQSVYQVYKTIVKNKK
ncbi:MAG: glycosyltransferase, partial [Colwellia sp.]